MINKVILLGNLGKDPEVKRFDNGGIITRFSLATNENYRDKDGEWQTITDWHTIVLRGNLAERSEKYLKKGMTIYLEGKIRTRKWQDNSGNDNYTTEVLGVLYKAVGNRREDTDTDTKQIESPNKSIDSGNNANDKIDDLPF